MPAPGGFTYSRAVREWAFVQVPLMSLSDFRKAAGERGLMKVSPFDASPWETLDREDLLPPSPTRCTASGTTMSRATSTTVT